MKTINFINPLPPHHKQELRRWCLYSATIIATSFAGIIIVTFAQWRLHRHLIQQQTQLQQILTHFNTTLEQQHKSQQEVQTLQKKVHKLTSCTDCPKNPIDLIAVIRNAIGPTSLHSFSVTKKRIELQTLCTHAKQATTIVNNLAHSKQFENIQLVSLESVANNQLSATIRAVRVKQKKI